MRDALAGDVFWRQVLSHYHIAQNADLGSGVEPSDVGGGIGFGVTEPRRLGQRIRIRLPPLHLGENVVGGDAYPDVVRPTAGRTTSWIHIPASDLALTRALHAQEQRELQYPRLADSQGRDGCRAPGRQGQGPVTARAAPTRARCRASRWLRSMSVRAAAKTSATLRASATRDAPKSTSSLRRWSLTLMRTCAAL